MGRAVPAPPRKPASPPQPTHFCDGVILQLLRHIVCGCQAEHGSGAVRQPRREAALLGGVAGGGGHEVAQGCRGREGQGAEVSRHMCRHDSNTHTCCGAHLLVFLGPLPTLHVLRIERALARAGGRVGALRVLSGLDGGCTGRGMDRSGDGDSECDYCLVGAQPRPRPGLTAHQQAPATHRGQPQPQRCAAASRSRRWPPWPAAHCSRGRAAWRCTGRARSQSSSGWRARSRMLCGRCIHAEVVSTAGGEGSGLAPQASQPGQQHSSAAQPGPHLYVALSWSCSCARGVVGPRLSSSTPVLSAANPSVSSLPSCSWARAPVGSEGGKSEA